MSGPVWSEARATGVHMASRRYTRRMHAGRAIRRSLLVVAIAGIAGGLVRLRGKGGVPPTVGGWRQLSGPEFR
ncbi:MAG: hypothetical protein ACKOZL_05685 [Actinomycetes bacterium]